MTKSEKSEKEDMIGVTSHQNSMMTDDTSSSENFSAREKWAGRKWWKEFWKLIDCISYCPDKPKLQEHLINDIITLKKHLQLFNK